METAGAALGPVMIALLALTLTLVAGLSVVVGVRDAPNAIALPVRTRALTPRAALILAAGMNLLGTVLAGSLTLRLGDHLLTVLPLGAASLLLLCVTVTVAGAWSLYTWWRGMPASTTHALTSGLAGAALALWVTQDLPDLGGELAGPGLTILLALTLSPLAAWFLAWALVRPVLWVSADAAPGAVNHRARISLALTGALNAVGHGLQIGQLLCLLAMLACTAAGLDVSSLWWLPGVVGIFLALGTLGGGWRIAHTLTERLVQLDPLRSAIASGVSAGLLFFGALALHLPLSSTHMSVASIVGAGQHQHYTAVRWTEVVRVVLYWLATLVLCFGVGLILAAALSPLV